MVSHVLGIVCCTLLWFLVSGHGSVSASDVHHSDSLFQSGLAPSATPGRLFGANESVLSSLVGMKVRPLGTALPGGLNASRLASLVGMKVRPLKTVLPMKRRQMLDAYSPSPSPSSSPLALCGNGAPNTNEECDYNIDKVYCSTSCTCQFGSVPEPPTSPILPTGSCMLPVPSPGASPDPNLCGNGVLAGTKKTCDPYFLDINGISLCDPVTCTCQTGTVPDGFGRCSYSCGNGELNTGEECDSAIDKSGYCSPKCKCRAGSTVPVPPTGTCIPPSTIVCSADANCDPTVAPTNLCSAVAGCKCKITAIPDPARKGACKKICGDGLFEPTVEECEYTLDTTFCNKGNCKCRSGSKPDPINLGKCLPTGTCGDGIFQSVASGLGTEQCDPAIGSGVGCTYQCLCGAGYAPDFLGQCVLTCGDGKFDPVTEECDNAILPIKDASNPGGKQRCGKNCKCLRGVPELTASGTRTGLCYCGNGQVECNNALPAAHCQGLTCKCKSGFTPVLNPDGTYKGVCALPTSPSPSP